MTGSVTFGRRSAFIGEYRAYLGKCATSADAEGRGVGTALMRACEQWARGQGCRILALSTGTTNTRARDFYARPGYHAEDVTLISVLEEADPGPS